MIRLQGAAGQSFGAFLAHGITLELAGQANDCVGKDLAGDKLIIYPPAEARYPPHDNILIGNTENYQTSRNNVFVAGDMRRG